MGISYVSLIGTLLMGVVLLVSFAAPLAMARLVKDYLPSHSQRLADSIACTIIESLLDKGGDPAQRLPAFLPASRGAGSDFMQRLYGSGFFKKLCTVIATMGPLSLPGYRYLRQRAG